MRHPRPLALLKDATTWLRSKVLHRPAVAPPEDDSNASAVAAETKAAETKPALSEASQKRRKYFQKWNHDDYDDHDMWMMIILSQWW